MNNTELVEKALEMCRGKGTLLYLTYVGSRLVGTSTASSDIDIRGVFIPDISTVLLGDESNSLQWSSSNDTCKNNPQDTDITLWSTNKWIDLLAKGDINAMCMLHPFMINGSNPASLSSAAWSTGNIIHMVPEFSTVMRQDVKSVVNIKLNSPIIAYMRHQVRGYDISGSVLVVLKEIQQELEKYPGGDKFDTVAEKVLTQYIGQQGTHVCVEVNPKTGVRVFYLAGVGFQGNTVGFQLKALTALIKKRSARLNRARKGDINWKDISHIKRSKWELIAIAKWLQNDDRFTGMYPLPDAVCQSIITIKNNTSNISWDEYLPHVNHDIQTSTAIIDSLPHIEADDLNKAVRALKLRVWDIFGKYPYLIY